MQYFQEQEQQQPSQPQYPILQQQSAQPKQPQTFSEKIIAFLKATFDLAEREREYGLSNFIAERQTAHGKHAWMLRSTLKTTGI
jgi:DNA-binding ferritin-like protein